MDNALNPILGKIIFAYTQILPWNVENGWTQMMPYTPFLGKTAFFYIHRPTLKFKKNMNNSLDSILVRLHLPIHRSHPKI